MGKYILPFDSAMIRVREAQKTKTAMAITIIVKAG